VAAPERSGSASGTPQTATEAAERSSPSTDAATAAAALGEPEAARELDLLLITFDAIAPRLSQAALEAAAERIGLLAASRAQGEGAAHDLVRASGQPEAGDSPLRVERLHFAEDDDDARSVAGSLGSADGDAEPADDGVAPLSHDGGLFCPVEDYPRDYFDPREDGRRDEGAQGDGEDDGDGDDDGGGANATDDGSHGRGGGDEGGGDAAAGGRDPRLGSFYRRDSIGLSQHGRRMYCDYHDLGGPCRDACMARDMLQQRSIDKLLTKLRNRRRRPQARRNADDPDGREARHACYKAIIKWQWASPLGAENRVRLPCCVVKALRREFPNPICNTGGRVCDFLLECERSHHYTGFRTAEESRAIREGRYRAEDLT